MFSARGCHSAFAIGGESKVARGEHRRLCILYIHVVHAGQVAHTASNGYIALVLNGTCLCAYFYAGISVLRVGVEGHKQYLHTVGSHQARQLGKLNVIANKDAYAATVGVEGLHTVALAQAPAFLFIGGNMYLLVHIYRSIAAAKEAHVIQSAIFLNKRH